jgi:small-conductance mechanosensitive channel
MKSHIQHRENHPDRRHTITRLSARSLFTAVATITGVVYTICFLSIALAPNATIAFFSYILHIDLTNIARPLSWGSFIVGLLFWSLGTGLYTAQVARLYNNLTQVNH